MPCRTETETVSRMEKAAPFDCCYSHQSVVSPSLCLSGLTVDSLSAFCGVSMVQCAKLMLTIFLNFGVLLWVHSNGRAGRQPVTNR